MWRILEKWRKKDEQTRQIIALTIAGLITLIIAGIWATVFFRKASEDLASIPAIDIKKGPIESIRETTSKFWESMTGQFEQVNNSLQDLKNVASSTDYADYESGYENQEAEQGVEYVDGEVVQNATTTATTTTTTTVSPSEI